MGRLPCWACVIKKTPHWSGTVSFLPGSSIGAVGTFLLHWGLVMNVVVVAPASILIFVASRWFDRPGTAQDQRREKLFLRLATQVDVKRELAGSVDQTTRVFYFLSRATGAVGLLSLVASVHGCCFRPRRGDRLLFNYSDGGLWFDIYPRARATKMIYAGGRHLANISVECRSKRSIRFDNTCNINNNGHADRIADIVSVIRLLLR